MSHYILGNEVIINNVNELVATNHSKFGNGIMFNTKSFIDSLISGYYNKSQTDTLLGNKLDASLISNYYTKTQADTNLSNNYYTKTNEMRTTNEALPLGGGQAPKKNSTYVAPYKQFIGKDEDEKNRKHTRLLLVTIS